MTSPKSKQRVNRLFRVQIQSLGIEMFICTLIPEESHITCQRQDIVIIDSRGVVCLVKKSQLNIMVFITGKVYDMHLN